MKIKKPKLTKITVLLLFATYFGCQKDVANSENEWPDVSKVHCRTPRHAVSAFFNAIADMDKERAVSSMIESDASEAYVTEYISLVRAMLEFEKIDSSRFGDGGLDAQKAVRKLVSGVVNNRIAEIDDSLFQLHNPPANPVDIRRTPEGWRIDMTSPENQDYLKFATQTLAEAAAMYDELSLAIERGDFATRNEVRDAMAKFDHSRSAAEQTEKRRAPESNSHPITIQTDSPESALRAFILATIQGDRAAIEAHSLPHDQLFILLTGDVLTEDQLKLAEKMLESTRIKSLVVGDSYALPNGTRIKVTESMVNDDRKLLTMIDNPIPFSLHKVGGQWKVDPSSVISVRKAAARLKREQHARQK